MTLLWAIKSCFNWKFTQLHEAVGMAADQIANLTNYSHQKQSHQDRADDIMAAASVRWKMLRKGKCVKHWQELFFTTELLAGAWLRSCDLPWHSSHWLKADFLTSGFTVISSKQALTDGVKCRGGGDCLWVCVYVCVTHAWSLSMCVCFQCVYSMAECGLMCVWEKENRLQ